MKLTACGCGTERLDRIERSWWMRLLFPGRRLYYCSACRSKRLIRKLPVRYEAQTTARPAEAGMIEPLRRG